MISRSGGHRVERIAADANVLLSAAAGKAAARVFGREGLSVVMVESVLEEVREYLHVMAASYRLQLEVLETQFALLDIGKVAPAEFKPQLEAARRRLPDADSADQELLAASLALHVPVWSNDNDFKDSGVEWFTTARLLRHLSTQRPKG